MTKQASEKAKVEEKYTVADRILRAEEVSRIVGLNQRTILMMENDGAFPRRIKLNKRAVGWKYSSIMKWIEEK